MKKSWELLTLVNKKNVPASMCFPHLLIELELGNIKEALFP